MKTQHIVVITALCAGLANGATLQLTTSPTNATILNDSIGSPILNAPWGIVVDTGGDGFGDYSSGLLGFSIASGFIGMTGDYFYLAANPTLSSGIAGAATQVIANYDDDPAVSGGLNYTIVWFAGKTAGETVISGDQYGQSPVTALLPASNAANPSPTDFQVSNGNASNTVVPEPSSFLLGTLGALCLLRRKR